MLELDLTTILLEILNFLVLGVGLYYFLFRPVMKRVEARAAEKERVEKEMRRPLRDAQRNKEDLDARLAYVNKEISQLMDEARDQIERERSQMSDTIHAEAEQARKDAENDIRRYQEQEIDQFNDRLLNTMITLSGEIIEKIAPPEVHDRLVQEANDFVWKLGKESPQEVETLRHSLGERTPTIYIASARVLNPDQQRMLARTFSALTDRTVNFDLETKPSLFCGVRVRVGDILIDNSIAAQLEKMRADVNDEFREKNLDG
ncbi:MAG: F0F1 ATP synthase subunit delta [Anaerolineaceae bacterium]|nr:F0F1 ATP synthase subunit delta [Anaerolineaceae bacterium]